jgi:hypothetical protein
VWGGEEGGGGGIFFDSTYCVYGGGVQQQINNFSSTITLIIACVGLLINSLGVSALAGIAVVACIGPLQGKLMRMAQLYRRDIAKVRELCQ